MGDHTVPLAHRNSTESRSAPSWRITNSVRFSCAFCTRAQFVLQLGLYRSSTVPPGPFAVPPGTVYASAAQPVVWGSIPSQVASLGLALQELTAAARGVADADEAVSARPLTARIVADRVAPHRVTTDIAVDSLLVYRIDRMRVPAPATVTPSPASCWSGGAGELSGDCGLLCSGDAQGPFGFDGDPHFVVRALESRVVRHPLVVLSRC